MNLPYESLISIEKDEKKKRKKKKNLPVNGNMFAFVAKRERNKKKVYICYICVLRAQRQNGVKKMLSIRFYFRFSSVGFIKVHFLYVITVLQ